MIASIKNRVGVMLFYVQGQGPGKKDVIIFLEDLFHLGALVFLFCSSQPVGFQSCFWFGYALFFFLLEVCVRTSVREQLPCLLPLLSFPLCLSLSFFPPFCVRRLFVFLSACLRLLVYLSSSLLSFVCFLFFFKVLVLFENSCIAKGTHRHHKPAEGHHSRSTEKR
ncbi:hypothetical protein BKA57DRAFT_309172 [Linnemannia elongata]|nr:hypothetical protein BKA57DRAFT_309172 [Linnemannia elongata]